MRELLLLSNSTNYKSQYLHHAMGWLSSFLKGREENIIFIPYAGVTITFDDYTAKLNEALASIGLKAKGLHTFDDPTTALGNATAILVGGGNTFQLLNTCYELDILHVIHGLVEGGTPYCGWSAGSNLAGKSIHTTNDMPIVEPPSFQSLGLIDALINPHYTELTINGHGGESRRDRLKEFTTLNSEAVMCLPEGTGLLVTGSEIQYLGDEEGKWIQQDQEKELNQATIGSLNIS